MAPSDAPQPPGGEPATNVRQFMVTNVAELIERLAYYGIVSVNALYLKSLGYSLGQLGLLSAVLLALPYVVPLLTGAVAEKLGYRPVMLAAMVVYAAGFSFIATGANLPILVTGVLLLGLGAGMFKPLTAATIAHVTSPKDRSLGYSLYYMGINVGGFLGPVAAAAIVTGNLGISGFAVHFSPLGYRVAYLGAAALMLGDFLLLLLLFRNPVAPRPETPLGKAFKPLVEVARDTPFMVLLLIFSGFWLLYSMNFTFLTLYLERFVPYPSWFDPSLQQAIDPLFVIILGIPLGKFAERSDSIRMMALGIGLSVAGFLLLGFVRTFPALVVGIIISTAGEVLAYPGFLGYVSRIAPRDRVAVYQGYGFLPIFLGFLVGPLVGASFYAWLAEGQGRPALFWAIMAGFGLVAIAAFLVYGYLRAPKPQRRRSPLAIALAVLIAIPMLIGAGAAVAAIAPPASPPIAGIFETRQGTLQEGTDTSYTFSVPAGGQPLTARVTWSDPSPGTTPPGAVNRPDKVTLVVAQDGKVIGQADGTNALGGDGQATFSRTAFAGNITVTLRLQAGDVDVQGIPVGTDTSTPFKLELARPS